MALSISAVVMIERTLYFAFLITASAVAIVAMRCWFAAEDDLRHARQLNQTLLIEREENILPLMQPVSEDAVRAAPKCVRRNAEKRCVKWKKP